MWNQKQKKNPNKENKTDSDTEELMVANGKILPPDS